MYEVSGDDDGDGAWSCALNKGKKTQQILFEDIQTESCIVYGIFKIHAYIHFLIEHKKKQKKLHTYIVQSV